MFGTLDGQLAAGVEVDDLRHAVERAAVLAQDVLVLLGPGQLHVHEALAAPGETQKKCSAQSNMLIFLNDTTLTTVTDLAQAVGTPSLSEPGEEIIKLLKLRSISNILPFYTM